MESDSEIIQIEVVLVLQEDDFILDVETLKAQLESVSVLTFQENGF